MIPVERTITLEFSSSTEIGTLLKKTLEDNQEEGLSRLIFQKQGEMPLNLPDFLASFQATWPMDISNLLDEQSFLLLLSGKGSDSRLALIVSTKDADTLAKALKNWEKTIEQNWSGLWSALGKTGPALVSYFRNGSFQGTTFRYQTFTKQDFGICYTLFNNYLIMTTSYSQMSSILNELKTLNNP